MDINDTKFFKMCRNYGYGRIVGSPDFKISLILATVLAVACGILAISKEMITEISIMLVTVSVALLAVIIAGLAIVVSISDDNFVMLLKKNNIYDNILFVFWYSAIMAGISIIFTTLSYALTIILKGDIIINNYVINNILFTAILWFPIFFTLYVLLSVITLVGTTMRWGLYRGAFIEKGYGNIKK